MIKYSYNFLVFGIILSLLGIGLTVLLKCKYRGQFSLVKNSVTKISVWGKENYVYVCSIATCTAIFIITQMICSCYPFGTKSTVSGDGLVQHFSFWIAQINSVKDGKFFPSFIFIKVYLL